MQMTPGMPRHIAPKISQKLSASSAHTNPNVVIMPSNKGPNHNRLNVVLTSVTLLYPAKLNRFLALLDVYATTAPSRSIAG